jgi:hypothetical protein
MAGIKTLRDIVNALDGDNSLVSRVTEARRLAQNALEAEDGLLTQASFEYYRTILIEMYAVDAHTAVRLLDAARTEGWVLADLPGGPHLALAFLERRFHLYIETGSGGAP